MQVAYRCCRGESVACLILCPGCRSILSGIKRLAWAEKVIRSYGLILFATTRGCMHQRTCSTWRPQSRIFYFFSSSLARRQKQNMFPTRIGMGDHNDNMNRSLERTSGVKRKQKKERKKEPGTCQGYPKQVMTCSHLVLPLERLPYHLIWHTISPTQRDPRQFSPCWTGQGIAG